MGTQARIIADSMNPNGYRLTTMALTYPLIIHNELMTYRMFSRNVASNRAIPVDRMIKQVEDDPFIPERWPINAKGMQPSAFLTDPAEIQRAREDWLLAAQYAIRHTRRLRDMGIHKQLTNRPLYMWLWTVAIVSSTTWGNFFHQRLALTSDGEPMAQWEMYDLACKMKLAYDESAPTPLKNGDWHTPYLKGLIHTAPAYRLSKRFTSASDIPVEMLPLVQSAGHCARVSYLRQDDEFTAQQDFDLGARLIDSRPLHGSPLEHVAQAVHITGVPGNFEGFFQFRHCFERENVTDYTE